MSEQRQIKKSETTSKGTWWLPEKPERKLLGEITYGPTSGAILKVFDYFFADGEFGPFVVWGETLGPFN